MRVIRLGCVRNVIRISPTGHSLQKQHASKNKDKTNPESAERILISRCDLCDDQLPKEADNIQHRITISDEIDNSYESEYDKHEPKLLLCSSCESVLITYLKKS